MLSVLLSLAMARVVTLFPIKWWLRLFGLRIGGMMDLDSDGERVCDPSLEYIGGYIMRVERFMPWRNRCLPSALAGALLFRSQGVSSKIVLGVNRSDKDLGMMAAHAWLVVGRRVITGFQSAHLHKPVAVISCDAR